MDVGFNIGSLIENGDVVAGVEGSSVEDVYTDFCSRVELPETSGGENILAELLEREKVLSTAVGNGIAIPHPRRPLLKNAQDQRIYVCFPKDPIDMKAPDSRKVYAMFVLLSANTQFHIKVLSELARLFRDPGFKKVLESRPSKAELLEAIKSF